MLRAGGRRRRGRGFTPLRGFRPDAGRVPGNPSKATRADERDRAEPPTLDAIRLPGGRNPGVVATCAADGTPNVAFLSQVGTSTPGTWRCRSSSSTRRGATSSPTRAAAVARDPPAGRRRRIASRSTTCAPRPGRPLRAHEDQQLASIASHTGMSSVFKRCAAATSTRAVDRAADLPGGRRASRHHRLSVLRRCTERIAPAPILEAPARGDAHPRSRPTSAFPLLILDAAGERLYTVASRGYGASGVGSEIPLGEGDRRRGAHAHADPINYMTLEYTYSRRSASAWRERRDRHAERRDRALLPGLEAPHSQLALPIACGDALLGVLFCRKPAGDMRFSWDDEDAMASIAAHLGVLLRKPAARRGGRRRGRRAGPRSRPRPCPPSTAAPRRAPAARPASSPRQRLPSGLPDQGPGSILWEAAARPRLRGAAPSSPTASSCRRKFRTSATTFEARWRCWRVASSSATPPATSRRRAADACARACRARCSSSAYRAEAEVGAQFGVLGRREALTGELEHRVEGRRGHAGRIPPSIAARSGAFSAGTNQRSRPIIVAGNAETMR